jgi:hypothetical protein
MFNVSMVMRMLTGILQMEGKAKDIIHNNEHQHIHVLPPHYTPMKWLNMLIIIIINSFQHTTVAHLSMVKTFLIITRLLESVRLLLSVLQRSENFMTLMISLLTRWCQCPTKLATKLQIHHIRDYHYLSLPTQGLLIEGNKCLEIVPILTLSVMRIVMRDRMMQAIITDMV